MARIYLSAPDVGPLEREYLLRAFDEGWIAPVGPELARFEHDITRLTRWSGAVALTSGTAALHLALLGCGVRPGDDVFVSSFTFVATANAVAYCGARPVFIDSDPGTWNMSPVLLAEALDAAAVANRLPKAAIVVDLYGQPADYDVIAPLLAEHGIPIVEDAAEALGAIYKDRSAGTLGAIGVFSFNGNKITTTSGGGMLVSPDPAVADHVRYLATQARRPADHYEHAEVGFNYRLSNLLAALGRAQLERLPEMSKRRLEINELYRSLLGSVDGLHFMPVPEWSGWNGWLTCVVFDDAGVRDRVHQDLAAADIESRPLWKPMHLQPLYAGSPRHTDGTSERLFDHGLCLPSGSALCDDDVSQVADRLLAAVRSRR